VTTVCSGPSTPIPQGTSVVPAEERAAGTLRMDSNSSLAMPCLLLHNDPKLDKLERWFPGPTRRGLLLPNLCLPNQRSPQRLL
jgi:hypothetical protein